MGGPGRGSHPAHDSKENFTAAIGNVNSGSGDNEDSNRSDGLSGSPSGDDSGSGGSFGSKGSDNGSSGGKGSDNDDSGSLGGGPAPILDSIADSISRILAPTAFAARSIQFRAQQYLCFGASTPSECAIGIGREPDINFFFGVHSVPATLADGTEGIVDVRICRVRE